MTASQPYPLQPYSTTSNILIFIGCSGLQIFSKYSAVNSPG